MQYFSLGLYCPRAVTKVLFCIALQHRTRLCTITGLSRTHKQHRAPSGSSWPGIENYPLLRTQSRSRSLGAILWIFRRCPEKRQFIHFRAVTDCYTQARSPRVHSPSCGARSSGRPDNAVAACTRPAAAERTIQDKRGGGARCSQTGIFILQCTPWSLFINPTVSIYIAEINANPANISLIWVF